jgi:hypothetical protein
MNQKNYVAIRTMVRTRLDLELGDDIQSLPEGRVAAVVQEEATRLGVTDLDIGVLVAELESDYQTLVGVERALVAEDDGWAPWLNKRKAEVDWFFWDRYQQYLRTEKSWPKQTIERLDQTTDKVLGYISNPESKGAWDRRGMVVGHVQSGKTSNYVGLICTDFQELHGDRQFNDDRALIGGTAFFKGEAVMIVAQQKGRDTKEKITRNFGMPQPEGYRKALRLMKLAEKFGLPVITFIDTPGAFPGIESEARHVSEAIAVNLREMAMLKTPFTGFTCPSNASSPITIYWLSNFSGI